MLENLDPREGSPASEHARNTTEQEPKLTDREVPLASSQTPEAIHAWLDGESVNEQQLHAAGKQYAFWRKVEEETGRRRRAATPAFVPAQIMSEIKKKD